MNRPSGDYLRPYGRFKHLTDDNFNKRVIKGEGIIIKKHGVPVAIRNN